MKADHRCAPWRAPLRARLRPLDQQGPLHLCHGPEDVEDEEPGRRRTVDPEPEDPERHALVGKFVKPSRVSSRSRIDLRLQAAGMGSASLP